MDKYIEVAGGPHLKAKQKGKVQIKMCNDNRDNFIATLHNILLAPDLCDRLSSIITLINLRHTCLFHKGFCMVYFGEKEKNAINLPHNAQQKHAFFGENKANVKIKENST